MGLTAKERRELVRALTAEDAQERAYGAFELAEAGVRSERRAVEALLGDAVPLVRGAAAYAVWRLGGGADAAVELIPLLKSLDEETRQMAVHALGRMGEAAIPALEHEVQTSSAYRREARRVLAEIQGGEDAAAD